MFDNFTAWKKQQELINLAFYIRKDTERLDRIHGVTACAKTADFIQVKNTLGAFSAERAAREAGQKDLDSVLQGVDTTLEKEEVHQDTPIRTRAQTRNKRKAKTQVRQYLFLRIRNFVLTFDNIFIGFQTQRRHCRGGRRTGVPVAS